MDRLPLTRPRDERVLAGVCAGLARHLDWPVGNVRIGLGMLCLLGGAGGLLYLWLWATVPLDGESDGIVPMRRVLTRPSASTAVPPVVPPVSASVQRAATGASAPASSRAEAPHGDEQRYEAHSAPRARARWPIAELLLGTCLLIVGVSLALTQLGVSLNLELILPGLVVLVGVGLTWWQIADRDRPDRNQLPRVLAALALVAVGVLMFFVTAREPSVWTVIVASIAVLAGVALALAPWALRINRELIAERAGREREAERAEIAAHLHDSVLQTLALIQQRSTPGSEIARIARGQERELREWLFRVADGGAAARQEAIDSELRAHAAVLETEHPVRFEIVVVGGGAVVPEPIVAAAREAMLNAARHAGGTVTVYVECSPSRVSVDITDRGPGLDLEALPEGRMGVRESIFGRMSRAGGEARIVAGPGGTGTAVRLSLPLEIAGPASDPVQNLPGDKPVRAEET